jgi:PAS domain S-box-containing protein
MNQFDLFNLLSLGIVLVNDNEKVISLNPAVELILGLPAVELLNMKLCETSLRFKTQDGEPITPDWNPIKSALEKKENILNNIMGLDLGNGKTRWLECDVIFRHQKTTDEPWSVAVCLKDITQIREIEYRYKAIFDLSPFILVLNDLETNQYVDVNREFCSFKQTEKEYCIGKTPLELGYIHDEQLDRKLHDILIKEGQIKQFEFNSSGKKGENISLLWVQIIELLGKKYSLTALQDITDRKIAERELRKSEAKYRILYEQMFDAFVRVDMNGKIIQSNVAFRQLTGYTSAELMEMTYLQLTPEKWKNKEEEIVKNQVIPFGHSELYEKEYIRKDGAIIPIEIRTSLDKDENQNLVGMWAIIRDLSDRKKAFTQLSESREQLRELAAYLQNIREEERIIISREIHDELGHLLTVLKLDLLDLQQKQPGDHIEVNEKINPMLDLVDAGIDSVRRIATELRPGILDHFGLIPALEWLTNQFQQRSKISFNFNKQIESIELSQTVTSAIFRIFQEMLTNIGRHSKASKVEIQIDGNNSTFALCVRDNGIGFDKEKKSGKTSLGLIDMKERALSIGAEFTINSIMGEGTEILLILSTD